MVQSLMTQITSNDDVKEKRTCMKFNWKEDKETCQMPDGNLLEGCNGNL